MSSSTRPLAIGVITELLIFISEWGRLPLPFLPDSLFPSFSAFRSLSFLLSLSSPFARRERAEKLEDAAGIETEARLSGDLRPFDDPASRLISEAVLSPESLKECLAEGSPGRRRVKDLLVRPWGTGLEVEGARVFLGGEEVEVVRRRRGDLAAGERCLPEEREGALEVEEEEGVEVVMAAWVGFFSPWNWWAFRKTGTRPRVKTSSKYSKKFSTAVFSTRGVTTNLTDVLLIASLIPSSFTTHSQNSTAA
mmetsp:Transcript_114/g.246  ORF Transcript_114/g.246 Transcript_114/m.246 type:complete len:251 (-) Transcript_114:656-1408(-)